MREGPLGTQQGLHGRHTHTRTRVYTQVHMCVSVHTSCEHTRASTRACTQWLTPTPHKHSHTQTLTSWAHGARGQCLEETRSCCDSDVEKVPSPPPLGVPRKEKKAGCVRVPTCFWGFLFRSFLGQLSLADAGSPTQQPTPLQLVLFCHFHPCEVTVQLHIPKAYKP